MAFTLSEQLIIFPIAEVAISVYPNIVIAYAMVKLACARANNQLGLLDDDIYHPIVAACERIINGEFHEQFVVEIIQGGAGTSTNYECQRSNCQCSTGNNWQRKR